MVKLEEFLKFKEETHNQNMHEILKKEKELQHLPYIDNMPL